MMAVIWPDKGAIIAAAEPIIKGAEGLRLAAYLCPAQKWTIGWGCTFHPNGLPISAGDRLKDEAEAEVYLLASENRELDRLERSGAVNRSPNVNQAGAFLSLAYNVPLGIHDGVKGDLADSSLFACFNAGDDRGAADHFLDWDKAHVRGVLVVLPGLAKRRTTERDLFLKVAA